MERRQEGQVYFKACEKIIFPGINPPFLAKQNIGL